MNKFKTVRCTLAALFSCAAIIGFAPASAKPIGNWDFQSSDGFCSIGTNQNGGTLIMITTKSGLSVIMVIPADQAAITVGKSYPLKVSLEGLADAGTNASALEFGGSKVLVIDIDAAGLAAAAPDGLALRVKLNDVPVFDKNMHGSSEAFAAYVACSKAFTRS